MHYSGWSNKVPIQISEHKYCYNTTMLTMACHYWELTLVYLAVAFHQAVLQYQYTTIRPVLSHTHSVLSHYWVNVHVSGELVTSSYPHLLSFNAYYHFYDTQVPSPQCIINCLLFCNKQQVKSSDGSQISKKCVLSNSVYIIINIINTYTKHFGLPRLPYGARWHVNYYMTTFVGCKKIWRATANNRS